jgi:hypothetical protein
MYSPGELLIEQPTENNFGIPGSSTGRHLHHVVTRGQDGARYPVDLLGLRPRRDIDFEFSADGGRTWRPVDFEFGQRYAPWEVGLVQ